MTRESGRSRIEAGEQNGFTARYRRKDGTIFPIELRTILSRDADGRPESMWAVVRDITARKEIAARMEVLVAELQHRTRNLIAVVRSIGNQTMSNATSLKSFWDEFSHRLGALSRVQPGQTVHAVLDAYPGTEFVGRVVALSTKAEFTPRVALTEKERADLLFGVKIEFADTTGMLKAGLPITVHIDAPARAP